MREDRSVLLRPSRPADQVLRYGPDPEHILEVRLPRVSRPERPLVLLVHGGFWRPEYDRTHTGPMAEALAAAGWIVATIEYRRSPGCPDVTLRDVARAIERAPELVTHHNGKLLLIGHSAGGHLVLWAAASCRSAPIQGVVALAPVADLQLAHARGLDSGAVLDFLGVEPRQRLELDPTSLPTAPVRRVLLHGQLDAIVPLAISESYLARHSEATLIRVPDAGHFALIDPLSAAWCHVLAALESLV